MKNIIIWSVLLIIGFPEILFSESVAAQEHYAFAGQASDKSIALQYNRARFFDPETGTFLSKDPISIQGGLNQYLYCFANPVNLVDPLGLEAWDSFWGGVRMFGGGLQFAAGYSLAAAGVGASATGIGSTVGVPGIIVGTAVGAHGADTFQAGARQLFTGMPVDTFTSQTFQSAGLSQSQANLLDAGIGIVGSGGAGLWSGASKVSAMSKLPEASGMSISRMLTLADEGAVYIPNYRSLPETFRNASPIAKGLMVESGEISIPAMNLWQRAAGSTSIAYTGLTAKADIFAGFLGSGLLGANGVNLALLSARDQSGVLIDKAAELVGSNLADIKGATYDPVSNQIIFLGSNSTPGVEGIDMDYFYTAVQAVYGSAIPPYVSLDAPASAASLWQDLGDGDGNFEAQEWGGFTLRYNPLWAEVDSNVAVRVKCKIGATNYDFNVNFTPQTIDWLQYPNGQYPMHLVYSNITGTAPPGISVWDGPFTSLPYPQTVLDYVNTSSNTSGGQDWTYSFQLYNGGTGTITNISFAVIPDRQHRRFGGRLEGTKLGWVLQEADRIMKIDILKTLC